MATVLETDLGYVPYEQAQINTDWEILRERIETSGAFSAQDANDILFAYAIANDAHAGQRRISGEPYITHPIATASLLLDAGVRESDTIAIALLHDVLEDTNYLDRPDLSGRKKDSWDRLSRAFDNTAIPVGIDSLTAPPHDGTPASRKYSEHAHYVELSTSSGYVILVKMADRLHNLLTLSAMPWEKQMRKIEETFRFMPIFTKVLGDYPKEGKFLLDQIAIAIEQIRDPT